MYCLVSWGCRIHPLPFSRGQEHSLTSVQDMTLNNPMVGVPVMLELWGMRRTPSLPSFLGPLWPGGVVAPGWVLSIYQIELNCVLMLNWIVWNRTAFDIETEYWCLIELLEIELFWHLNFVLILTESLEIDTFSYSNCVLRLNCVLCFRELLEIELFWHLNYVLILNWIVWTRTVCLTEIFEIEIFFIIKMCTYVKLNCLM